MRLNIIYALSLSPSLSEVGGGAQNQLMRPLVGLRWIQGERKRQKSVSGILKIFRLKYCIYLTISLTLTVSKLKIVNSAANRTVFFK